MENKIYDCTTFYNANLLFEMRFQILKDKIDYFVVCEANKDHTGNSKKFNFNPNLTNDEKKKIIYIKVTDLPSIKLKGRNDYKLLILQMENLHKGIKDANDEDLIIYSDEDEIVNPSLIDNFDKEKYKIGIFLQNMYYYKLNVMNVEQGSGNWAGSRICKKKNLKSFWKLHMIKTKNIEYPYWRIDKEKSIQLIKNGGWHFSYLMKPEDIIKKIESMAHTEFNKKDFKNVSKIEENVKNLTDLYSRGQTFKKVSIDETYPDYIRNNLDKYKQFILDDTNK